MTQFNNRREAYESKFAHDETMRFKATARRNRLLGLWAAQQLGKAGAEAQNYAATVVMADFEEPGDEDVIRKIVGDFAAAGIRSDESLVRRALEDLMVRAIDEIKAGM